MNGTNEARGEAKGKIVLLGEHAVVHGSNAVAVALSKGAVVHASRKTGPTSLNIKGINRPFTVKDNTKEGLALSRLIETLGLEPHGVEFEGQVQVPQRAGLGSSAALAAATARALVSLKKFTATSQLLFEAVQASEKVFHGNPSGLDASMALEGGAAIYSRSLGVRPFKVPKLPIIIVHSGEQGDTGEMVKLFSEGLKKDDKEGTRRVELFDAVIEKGIQALQTGDLKSFGEAMNDNHELLMKSGVSTPSLDRIVKIARESGALGAKLTGGGGGGCAVVLVKTGDDKVARVLHEAGFKLVEME